jgi:hypothetical protein
VDLLLPLLAGLGGGGIGRASLARLDLEEAGVAGFLVLWRGTSGSVLVGLCLDRWWILAGGLLVASPFDKAPRSR